jgi:RimJ/RimL family protein N-acetyltransferase
MTVSDLFKGNLVRLAGIDPDEFSKLLSNWGRDSEYARLLDSDPPRLHSVRANKEWLEKRLKEDQPDTYWFAIRALEDDRLLGDIDVAVINWGSRDAFIGIGIGEREFWGQGYGSDALQLLLRYAFIELNLRRVTLNVFEFNQRAIRVYEKVGFQTEGRQRLSVQREGRRWDTLFMGLLREEWMEENGKISNNE